MENKHPLKDPNSSHYGIIDGIDSIDIMEKTMTTFELMGWAKGNVLKYQLRLGKKDNPEQEIAKIKRYQDYYHYLKEQL